MKNKHIISGFPICWGYRTVLSALPRRYGLNRRLDEIIRLFGDKGFATVSQLAEALDVSPMTIRRDLAVLEGKNLIRRTHGGAVLVRTLTSEPVYSDRASINVEAKERIAESASSLVEENMVIAIDTGSTCFSIMPFLSTENLTIVTTSFRVMAYCMNHSNIRVIVPGGVLRPHEGSICGSDAIEFLSKLHVDLFFMGIGGVDKDSGYTDYSLDDIAIKKTILGNAARTAVLADSSKVGRITFGHICDLGQTDYFITDHEPGQGLADSFSKAGVEVITPKEEAYGHPMA